MKLLSMMELLQMMTAKQISLTCFLAVSCRDGDTRGISLIKQRNKRGPIIEPCGTPKMMGRMGNEWLL